MIEIELVKNEVIVEAQTNEINFVLEKQGPSGAGVPEGGGVIVLVGKILTEGTINVLGGVGGTGANNGQTGNVGKIYKI